LARHCAQGRYAARRSKKSHAEIHQCQESDYEALGRANKKIDVTVRLTGFADMALKALRRAITQVEFLIVKAKLFDRLRGHINDRQQNMLRAISGAAIMAIHKMRYSGIHSS
jgi:hypothetical protein